jgi:hypothetical protein
MAEQGLAVQQSGVINFEEYAMSGDGAVRQVNLIQNIMSSVMKKDEHYGTIPGCQKPSLYKPGAEKLSLVFRLRPEYRIARTDMSNGHREYEVTCTLYHIPTGQSVGEGVGSATTMEGKFRFRGGEKEGTGQPVPTEYWNLKNAGDMEKARALIGGPGFGVGKIDGKWEICVTGDKQEHDNPADYYNTVLKMAKKRAHVDAILTATAASDIFTQDIEDMPEVMSQTEKGTPTQQESPKKDPPKQPQSKSAQTGDKDLRAEITNMVKEMIEEDLRNDYLLDKTAWDGKDKNTGEKKHFEGKTDLTQVSDAAIKVVYGKVKKDYEAWQKQGQADA